MKLSVAMITYNHEQYIGQAIESILAQNVNFEYEIVIGEDCSTDGTRAVITAFQRRYPERIKLLLRDRNVGSMRNFTGTIEACHGEYLALLEGDDYWIATDKLQKQINFLDAHPECAICCGRVQAVYEAGTQNVDVGLDVVGQLPAGPYTIEDILKGNFVMTCTVVLRRKYIGEFPKWFFEMKLGDWPLYAMVARYGTIELVDEILAAYRIHSGGVWSSVSQAVRAEESLRMLKALDKEFRYEYRDAIRETIASMYHSLALDSRSKGRRIETARHLVNYIRNGGWHRPGSARVIAGLITYEVIGSWYKLFSGANSSKHS
jgi:glycosyltransferase involved in cell wall biosynthesis